TTTLYTYTITRHAYERIDLGKKKLVTGRVTVRSLITWKEDTVTFVVLHLGDHNLVAGVRNDGDDGELDRALEEVKSAFSGNDIPETMHRIDTRFGAHKYSLRHLFKDEQRKVLREIFGDVLEGVGKSLQQLNERYFPILQVMKQMRMPLPKILTTTVGLMINSELSLALEEEVPDADRVRRLVEDARKWAVEIDDATLGYNATEKVTQLMEAFAGHPDDPAPLEKINDVFTAIAPLSLAMNLWRAQNMYFAVCTEKFREKEAQSAGEDARSRVWVSQFRALGTNLNIDPEGCMSQ
ncbi:MAG: DUF3536 domain-containing protein, partial [Candidatus Omnitrophica bacterium]|nr:DUF3536 domain-containing protein [Candidatus Omnitrophota bacterium]